MKKLFLKYSSWYGNSQVGTVILKLVRVQDHPEIEKKMANRFWKSMPAALKRPILDELYRRLRDLDYTQVDERMAVMLNAILQLEDQGECRESATEAVLMVGYTTDGISNQEQTRWLSWNVDGGVRGFDFARNPGLSNNTEYGAGEIPLPTRPSAKSAGQHTNKTPSMTRAQQTEEAYPDLSSLKRELERTQRERNKANLDRDQAKLERDQANLERDQAVIEKDQARWELDMLKAEHQQEQRVRENAAKFEQLKSELERIQRRQRELDVLKGARPKERTAAGSRPESRMEVDEAPRSKGRFNLDRAAQEHVNEGLEVWIPTESTSSLHGLETQPIRPLMDVALPSQVSGSSSRLKEMNERLQLRKSGVTPDLEGATDQECGNLKLQEEHGWQIPQAQSHGLEHSTKSQAGLLP